MTAFGLKKAARLLLFLWAAASLTFFLVHALPGDPVLDILGPNPSSEDVLRLRRSLQLDQPLATQYARYVLRLAVLDLGESLVDRKPVLATMLRYLPNTALLAWPPWRSRYHFPCCWGSAPSTGKTGSGKRWPRRSRQSGWRFPFSSSAFS